MISDRTCHGVLLAESHDQRQDMPRSPAEDERAEDHGDRAQRFARAILALALRRTTHLAHWTCRTGPPTLYGSHWTGPPTLPPVRVVVAPPARPVDEFFVDFLLPRRDDLLGRDFWLRLRNPELIDSILDATRAVLRPPPLDPPPVTDRSTLYSASICVHIPSTQY